MTRSPSRERIVVYLLWAACALAAACAVAVVVAPLGGVNRVDGAALPFTLTAAALAAIVLLPSVERWITLVLYMLALLSLTYGVMVAASLPLRLSVIPLCSSPASGCPTGFEPAMTHGETFAMEATVALGIATAFFVFCAFELRYSPRVRVFGRSAQRAAPEPAAPTTAATPAPPPQMRPSAIAKKPATSTFAPAGPGAAATALPGEPGGHAPERTG